MDNSPLLLLVNSDDQQRQELSCFIASCSDFKVLEVDSGAAAIASLNEITITSIVSDLDLDDMDAWCLSRFVRSGALSCSKSIPFFIISSKDYQPHIEITAQALEIQAIMPFAHYLSIETYLSNPALFLPEPVLSRVLAVQTCGSRDVIDSLLSNRYYIEYAQDEKEAIRVWREHLHEIILFDVSSPPNTKTEAFASQVLLENPNQGIVLISRGEGTPFIRSLMIRGVIEYLHFPFTGEQFHHRCEAITYRQQILVNNGRMNDSIHKQEVGRLCAEGESTLHKEVLDNLSTSVIELNAYGEIAYANRSFRLLMGLGEVEVIGSLFTNLACRQSLASPDSLTRIIDLLLIGKGKAYRQKIELRLLDTFKHHPWVEARFKRIVKADNTVAVSVAIDDISIRKHTEQQLEHLAIRDVLTGSYNRVYFESELARLVTLSKKGASEHCLLYLDLDHFKAINDTKGHHQGDVVLKSVAERLQNRLRESDRLCRIGGDEFAVLLMDTILEDGESIAKALCHLIAGERYQLTEQAMNVSCSIGISRIGCDESNPQTYLQQADIALYVAKNHGRNCVHVFSEEDAESGDVKRSMEWLHTVKHAIEKDRLVLHYQPIYDVSSNHIEYYEALVRLKIDDRIVYPGDFIPALERFDDTSLLDQHVIRMAIKHLSEYPQLPKIAVNLSARAFSNDNLVPLIEELLTTFDVRPGRVVFELTESASLTNLSATQKMVQKIHDMGCAFSIDDFGTGFSTFAYLKNLPAETVKIDGSFIRELTRSQIDRALVTSIREVATALGKKTVAEFVEDQETLNVLRDIKVDYAQGYHLGRPQSLEQLFSQDEVELLLGFD
jgi:diguanylate cyclase (GGDEF)-like protein/PAS domain S-box-containing protein